MNGEIKIKKGTTGFYEYDPETGEVLNIYGGSANGTPSQGVCFKDKILWERGCEKSIVYVSESGINDYNNRESNGVKFEDVAWTKEGWIEAVREAISETIEAPDERYITNVANDIFNNADWADLMTELDEWLEAIDLENDYDVFMATNCHE